MTASETHENPYAVESAAVASGFPTQRSGSLSWLMTGWIAVVLINLPIPLLFGKECCKQIALLGMPIGILLILAIGLWGCRIVPRTMILLNSGAVVTALSQFWPFLHMMIGSIALALSQFLFERDAARHDLTRVTSAASATILTGSGLILVSFVFGAVIQAFVSLFQRR
ncbi:MAG: hypothetical protein U0996_01560 [Planctomycetaceae bacterium]